MSLILPNAVTLTSCHSTVLLSCTEIGKQREFEAFQRLNISLCTFGIFVLFSCMSSVYYKILLDQYSKSQFNLLNLIFSSIFEFGFGVSLLGFMFYVRHHNPKSNDHKNHIGRISYFENLFCLSQIISLILV